jgi:signal transduction histidine kinase/DNA-binding response OmpR family regulator
MKTAKKTVLFLSFALLLSCLGILQGVRARAADGSRALISLTDEERAFIKEHPVIRLSVDPTFVPYEFFDSDGVYKGIAADYIDLICKKTGLQMVPEKDLTWADAYEKAVKKESDVLPCVSLTKQRQEYFLYSEPYFTFQRAVYVRKDDTDIKSIADLSQGSVAVQLNSSHQGFLTTNYPDIHQNLYQTVEECLLAVSSGIETAFVGNLATSNYLAKSLGITNLKYIDVASNDSQSLYFAVRNDWPVLVGIINKALAAVTREEKIEISNKWLGVQEGPDYSQIIKIAEISGGVVLLILIVSAFWILRLRREVAKRKKAQEELRVAKEEAERANQVKSLFLARMSHEVRTPLHTIMGMGHLFRKTELTTTQGIYLEKMTQAARNMLGIINDILDFSKIEAGKIDIESIPFDLDTVILKVLNIESVKVVEQGIELALQKESDLPRFFIGDPGRLEQILLNIVSNAVKFTRGGSVTISAGIHSRTGNRYTIEFGVSDTGIGMSQEQLERLFVPFDQADQSISRRFGGTGLGMPIVKNLVELMGGTLNVVSVLGAGSTFTVRLPFDMDEAGEKLQQEQMAADCFKNIKALVLDKNDAERTLLESCLKAFGVSADLAPTAYDALMFSRQAQKEGRPYNLMIVDFLTPDENGVAYINKRKKQDGGQTKYILMIPMAREELFEDLESAGIDFGIIKPVISSVLYNCIIEMFSVKPPDTKKRPEEMSGGNIGPHPYHILLVEDNKTNQYIARAILEQAGFEVTEAGDGGEGIRLFGEHRQELDLILMDIHMPDMDGYTASDRIREIDADIPIVAMTADAISGVAEKCRSHGMAHYVSKPFEPDELINTILRILDSREKKHQPEPESMPPKPGAYVLDLEDGLRRIGGDREMYKMILQEYLNENRLTLEELQGKINQGDYPSAAQIAHKVKSSSGNIGAKPLYDAAAALQKALSDAEDATVPSSMELFGKLLNQVLDEIKANEQNDT